MKGSGGDMEPNEIKRPKRSGLLKYFASGLAGAILSLVLFMLIGSLIFPQNSLPRLTAPPQSVNPPIEYGRLNSNVNSDVTAAAEKVMPSVVSITVRTVERGRVLQGVGSGVVIDSAGYILTNNHVAGGNVQAMVVSLSDGRNVNGTTIWADPTLDLAIVKVDAANLTAATLGDSKAAVVGQQAIAIGNPLGLTLQRTVTAGIISALNRTIEVKRNVFMEGLIQTDASINPGNSGGPLVNIKGEVVGINTIKVTSGEGLGFAVPINVAKPVIESLRSKGVFETPEIAMQALDRDMGNSYNFALDKGVYVYDCKDGGCAYKAGIRKGEAVLSVNGTEVDTAAEFKEALYRAKNAGVAKLRVRNSSGAERDVTIRLDGKE